MVSTRPSRVKGHLKRTASKPGKGSALSVTPPKTKTTPKAAKGKPAAPSSQKRTPKSTPKSDEEASGSGSRTAPKSDKKEKKVRVWWPPTKDKRKTQYSGAYWPATVIRKYDKGYEVKYDNGYTERVDKENVGPYSPPVPFGEEKTPLQEFEFCEVHNGSKTDPAAWFGCVDSVEDKGYRINYPFHDSSPEIIKPERVRRARVWDRAIKEWHVVKPYQEWDDGEVASPTELELIPEKELSKVLKQGPPADFNMGSRTKTGRKKSGAKGEGSTKKTKEPAKRGRKKKEVKEEASDDEEEEEEEEEKPAKKRKVDKAKGKGKAKEEAPATPLGLPAGFPANLMAAIPAGTQMVPVMIPSTTPGAPPIMMMVPSAALGSLFPSAVLPGSTPPGQPSTSAAAAAAAAAGPSTSTAPAAATTGGAGPSKATSAGGEDALHALLGTDAEETDTGEDKEKEKKKKQKKDPHAPKRPITAYLVFVQRNRDKILADFLKVEPEGPAPSSVDISRMVAAKWKEVAEEEKQICEETAEKDRQRYLAEMATYKPPEGLGEDDDEDDGKDGKAKKDPNAPRKPASAYILFCKEYRKTIDTTKVSFTEATNKAAEAWRLADPDVKAKYEALAAVDKERHHKESADYRAQAAAALITAAAAAPAKPAAPTAAAGGASGAPLAAAAAAAAAPPLQAGLRLPSALAGAGLPQVFRFPNAAAPFQMFTMPTQQPLPKAPALAPSRLDQETADILANGLDMKKAKIALARFYSHDAYHMLLDVWRENSPKLGDAIRSFKQNVKGYQRPDWKGFMIGIFGMAVMDPLKKAPVVPLASGPAPPSTKPATGDIPQTSSTPDPSAEEEGGEEEEGEGAEGKAEKKKSAGGEAEGEAEGYVSC